MLYRLSPSKLDHELGLSYYLTTIRGIEGRIRSVPEDFVVEEVLRNKIIIPATPSDAAKLNIPLSGSGNFVRAVLIKRNCATLTAIYMLSRFLGIPVNAFSFLGLKDAKAVTSQLISIFSTKELNLGISDKTVKIPCYTRSLIPVKPHELYGNRFTIKIRSTTLSGEKMLSHVGVFISEVRKIGGLPAYFGYQRFGTIRPISHRVGEALLAGDYELAIKHVIEGYKSSSTFGGKSRRPLPVEYEQIILSHLEDGCRDYVKLVKKIPRFLRKLFVNAYQSYLFNKMLSLRIKFGLPLNEAVIGDLVGLPVVGSIPRSHIIVADRHNLSRINMLIYRGVASVVIPIIGSNTSLLPRGVPSEPVLKVLEEEEISSEVFPPEFYGAYRPVLSPVEVFQVLYVNSSEDGGHIITLRFVLRRGFYASILLRELIKPFFPSKVGF